MARGPIKPKVKKKKGQLRLKGISGIPVLVTARDVKIAEGIISKKGKIKSLVDAGVSEKNARSNSAELIKAPGVQKAINEALDRVDAGLDRIATVIDRGLDAKKLVTIEKEVYLVEDHAVQHQFVRTTAELRDWFPDKKLELPDGAGSLSVTIKRAAK